MLEIVHVSSRGQIVIPEKVRKRFGIKQGSRLVLVEQNGALVLKREETLAKTLGDESREEAGWLALAEQSMHELWDNPQDEEVWGRYI